MWSAPSASARFRDSARRRYRAADRGEAPRLREPHESIVEAHDPVDIQVGGIELLRQLAKIATAGLMPDLTLYLDIEAAEGIRRKHVEIRDRFEQQDVLFHETVRQGYQELIAAEPSRWVVIDAAQSIESIHEQIVACVLQRLPGYAKT